MDTRLKAALAVAVVGIFTVALSACGSEGIEVAQSSPEHSGAVIFSQRCAGCHTLKAAGTEGSSSSIKYVPLTAGPNLDQRKETVSSVLFAIRNGGFSGAIMPQNIVTGAQAQQVANFVAKYSGLEADRPPGPPITPESSQ